jgi:hypothetical protein
MPPKKQLIDVSQYYDKCSDLTKDYMPVSIDEYPYNLEVTISFDHKRHTKASAYAAQVKIVQYLLSWFDIEELVCVIEYQKNGFPHYHINVAANSPYPDGWAFDTMRAFERFYGFTSVKPIVDSNSWFDYLFKEVLQNNRDKPLCPHYTVYSKL